MQHLSLSFFHFKENVRKKYMLGEKRILACKLKTKKRERERGVCYTEENALYILWCGRIIMMYVLGKDGADNAPAEMFNSSLFVSDEVLRIEGVSQIGDKVTANTGNPSWVSRCLFWNSPEFAMFCSICENVYNGWRLDVAG